MSYFVVAIMAERDYAHGDTVEDGHGAYIHHARTIRDAVHALTSDPATYWRGRPGEDVPCLLFIVNERAQIVRGPYCPANAGALLAARVPVGGVA